jgi:hypothetical protein
MGFEDLIEVTDDIGTADAILASGSELRQNSWIRGVAKFHQLPVFVLKVPFCYCYLFQQLLQCGLLLPYNEFLFLHCSPIPWQKW